MNNLIKKLKAWWLNRRDFDARFNDMKEFKKYLKAIGGKKK